MIQRWCFENFEKLRIGRNIQIDHVFIEDFQILEILHWMLKMNSAIVNKLLKIVNYPVTLSSVGFLA